jgi:hypothetical protein
MVSWCRRSARVRGRGRSRPAENISVCVPAIEPADIWAAEPPPASSNAPYLTDMEGRYLDSFRERRRRRPEGRGPGHAGDRQSGRFRRP